MGLKIEFVKSGKTLEWNDEVENIRELAEDNGIEIPTDCGVGVCGTCKTKLLSGNVSMDTEEGLTDEDKDQGLILPCVAVPETNVKLEA